MTAVNYERINVIKQTPDGKLAVHQGWRVKGSGRKWFLDPAAQPIVKGTSR